MDTTNALFIQLALILGGSVLVGFLIKSLKLPLLVAYLIVGLLLSLSRVFDLTSSQALMVFPEIGIAFVLFFVGMELDFKEIKDLGKPILISSFSQIVISLFAGFSIASYLGFTGIESFFMGAGLAFSSTIVIVKLLLEKKEVASLYGKLGIGISLFEDLVAIIILMFMAVGSSVEHLSLQTSLLPIAQLTIKGLALLLLSLVLSRYVLKGLFNAVAESTELLFLSALSWCFVFVSFAILLGFSIVIGAFLAGVALANSPFHLEIQGKVKPLRDFFVTLFFVYLGSQVLFTDLTPALPIILIFTVYALVVKPLLFMLILGIFGFRKHTIFHTAISLSQISEFSLIVMVVGFKLGLVSPVALTAMALTGVLSIIASSTMISFSNQIYKVLGPMVGLFEKLGVVSQVEIKKTTKVSLEGHVILIGAHRMGGEVIKFLSRERIPFLVLDFNPGVVQHLMEQKDRVLYGDVGDPEVLEFLSLEKAKLIISTASSMDDNLILLSELKKRKARAISIIRASTVLEAKILYKNGADLVILPEIVSGDFVAELIKNHWPDLSYFQNRVSIEMNRLSSNMLALE